MTLRCHGGPGGTNAASSCCNRFSIWATRKILNRGAIKSESSPTRRRCLDCIQCPPYDAAGLQFLKESSLWTKAIIADSGLYMFRRQIQFIPRQICVQKRYQDSTVATIEAIIVYFHAPHGTTNDEVLHLRPNFKKVFGIQVESLSAERTSYPGDGLANSSCRVRHPENPELLGAICASGGKLIGHEALSLPDFH